MKQTSLFILMLTLLLAAGCATGPVTDNSPANISTGEPAVEAVAPEGEVAPVSEPAESVDLDQPSEAQPFAAAPAEDADVARPEGWAEASHSNEADPNYAVVFPEDKVNQMTIIIDPEDWAAMEENMAALFGEQGSGRPGMQPAAGPGGRLPEGMDPSELPFPPPGELPDGFPPPGVGELPEGFEPPAGARPPAGGPFGGRPGGLGGGGFASENPMWVAATIKFEGQTWTNVGVRYKGNSSLMSSWHGDSEKLPFKLDFDQFEDEYPEIDDQRFHGFKQLSLANNFSDPSFMRETVTYDLLEAAGLVAAETAYYELFVDYGEGPVSLGLYTMVEVIDDTVIERYFDDDSGNIYEADGPATSLAEGSLAGIPDSFQKENNQDEADWSDIEALYDVLHAEERTGDRAAWRAELEAIFDVDAFLEWLAISAVIQHWDAYGTMSHNYYLYNDPETGRLTWISWDHNMAMAAGRIQRGDVTIDKAEITEEWPLIRYLLDDPVYQERYAGYVAETINGVFNPDGMAVKYEELAELIAPYAAAEIGSEAFETAVQSLIDHAYSRAALADDYLAGR